MLKNLTVTMNKIIAIIGLGYVGLPLAIEFGKKYQVIGFDTNNKRINELKNGVDSTLEVDNQEIQNATNLSYTSNSDDIKNCSIFIVSVPTPIDNNNKPDFAPLISSSQTVGKNLSQGNIVIFESTVYPGATEEVCVPILESYSKLIFNKDFYCGYSPERINPGDKERDLTSIKKITSGSTPEVANIVDSLYSEIIIAGTHKVTSIRVAEAAKVIENTQRDLNIALINEVALIFDKVGIDTEEVLVAAGTKWNFLPFRPGLVGGHCLGVDPYYLTYKASEVGYHPEVILSGRRLNDNMGVHIAGKVTKLMSNSRINVVDSNVLIMGFAFKENCTDIRNTRVIDIVRELEEHRCNVDVYDPWVDSSDVSNEYGIKMIKQPVKAKYQAIILAVAHKEFYDKGINEIRKYGDKEHIIFDVKYIFSKEETDGRL
jgi:UDP-N-acetyl-D-glucosamine/UDP-N-acetyl-D-galactosamine dehydrogenase